MPLPDRDTRVTYPAGALVASTRVLHVAPTDGGRIAVFTEETSFHPVDAAWADQPADAGTIRGAGGAFAVRDAVVAATDGETLHLGADVPVRRGTDGWTFLVAHLVDDDADIAEGEKVEIEADAVLRRSLSMGHTACHVASLALNRVLAERWSKSARQDALGVPDFDAVAIASSRIVPDGSLDTYRLNKSLRRAGFDAAGLDDAAVLGALAASVEATLAEWSASDATVRIDRDGDGLTDRRFWVCTFPDGEARIPCGGTHADSLGELGPITVSFELGDDAGTRVLTMSTHAHPER